jgi:hypothetical protein
MPGDLQRERFASGKGWRQGKLRSGKQVDQSAREEGASFITRYCFFDIVIVLRKPLESEITINNHPRFDKFPGIITRNRFSEIVNDARNFLATEKIEFYFISFFHDKRNPDDSAIITASQISA